MAEKILRQFQLSFKCPVPVVAGLYDSSYIIASIYGFDDKVLCGTNSVNVDKTVTENVCQT